MFIQCIHVCVCKETLKPRPGLTCCIFLRNYAAKLVGLLVFMSSQTDAVLNYKLSTKIFPNRFQLCFNKDNIIMTSWKIALTVFKIVLMIMVIYIQDCLFLNYNRRFDLLKDMEREKTICRDSSLNGACSSASHLMRPI